ncbi:MAG: SGNH/GDSL hydrolase family protein [Oscillospiraceae bacterium]|nr:SGNH/GDSL hydrolase family protein [Oscillospiraceae bacterium]
MNKKKGKKKMGIILGCVAVFLLLQWLFIGYRFSFGPFKSLGDIRMAKLPGNAESYGMEWLDAIEGSPLQGKKILFLGSSVTYGAASLREGIPEYFAVRLDAEVTKEAVSGTTLTDDSDSSYVHRLLKRVDPATPYSLVVVQLSTNDASKNKPLGEISDSRNKEDFDTHTVTGAIEYIIAYSRETWGCPVVFYTGCRYDSEAYATMVERLMELQAKWGIGVLDLWSDEAFNGISDAERALYMYDPIHPTKAGYREWWCPELERQLLDYLA